MLGDVFYSLGSWVGGLTSDPDEDRPRREPRAGAPGRSLARRDDPVDAGDPGEDNGFLVDAILGSAAAWAVAKVLRPRSVSWPRVVVAGLGATLLSELVRGAVEAPPDEGASLPADDPDAVLIRLGTGVALAAGYAALLYPRLPGSPLVRGLAFGVMEIAAAPRGGLAQVARETPGIKFPLADLAAPKDHGAGPLSNLAFGVGLGLLYRPEHGHHQDDED